MAGGLGEDIVDALRANLRLEGQVHALQARCASLEEARLQAENEAKSAEEARLHAEEARAAAEARSRFADEAFATAISMKKGAEVERDLANKAKESADAEVARLQSEVEDIKKTSVTREGAWPAEKRRIALVLAASNRMAQKALAKEFPEVAEKFNIEKEGMEGAKIALTSVKPGRSEARTSN